MEGKTFYIGKKMLEALRQKLWGRATQTGSKDGAVGSTEAKLMAEMGRVDDWEGKALHMNSESQFG